MRNGAPYKAKPIIETELPAYGMFRLYFNNRKKHGRFPIVNKECTGTLYESGHVHLDTQELPVFHFLSYGQMQEYVESWGDCSVEWIG